MMKSLWQETTRQQILARADTLPETARPLWGTMSAGRMLRHVVQAMSMTVGELPTTPKRGPFRFFPLKQLAVYLVPIPKGVPTVPELLVEEETPIAASRAELHRLFTVFGDRHAATSWPDHPAFGRMSRSAWGILGYRHLDHHLRQFGV